jgi:hypothetical protein
VNQESIMQLDIIIDLEYTTYLPLDTTAHTHETRVFMQA